MDSTNVSTLLMDLADLSKTAKERTALLKDLASVENIEDTLQDELEKARSAAETAEADWWTWFNQV